MTNIINYTIIIPHRNTPTLLTRCLNSIPIRSDIQIIVVDDYSDPYILTEESISEIRKYSNLELILCKECKGAGHARNIGLSKAIGRWLIFADADDFFNSIFLSSIDKYLYSDTDIIYFSVNSVYSDTLQPGFRDWELSEMIDRAIVSKNFDELRFRNLGPIAKMISHQLIIDNKLKFDETMANNDCMFSVVSAYKAKNIKVDSAKIYCITCSKHSTIYSVSEKIVMDRLDVVMRVNKFLLEIHKKQYRISLIPFIVARNSKSFSFLIKRLKKVGLRYFFIDFYIDFFIELEDRFSLLKNKERRESVQKRKALK